VHTHIYSNLVLVSEAEVTTMANMMVIVLWCMLLNSLIGSYKFLGGTCCLHIWSRRIFNPEDGGSRFL
jgi:hypothetical protein